MRRRPMHVTFLSMVFPHPKAGVWAGIERWVGELGKALVKRGAKVSVITSFWNGGGEHDTWEGVEIHRLPDLRQILGRASYFMNLNQRSFGKSVVSRSELMRGADALHAFVALPIQDELRKLGVPLFASFPHREKAERPADHFTQMGRFRTEKHFLRQMDGVFAASAAARGVLVRDYALSPERVHVVHLGVNEDDFHPPQEARPLDPARERPEGIRLLYAGPLIPRKGLRTLLGALPVLDAAGVKYTLSLAGEGPQRGELQSLAARLGVTDKVRFAGFLKGEPFRRMYRDADVFVFPSILEGFGLVMVEAMASGLPVVTTEVPPMPEVVGEAGLTVPPGDPAALGEALKRIATDTALRSRLARESLRRVESHFLWSRVAEQTLEHYRAAGVAAAGSA